MGAVGVDVGVAVFMAAGVGAVGFGIGTMASIGTVKVSSHLVLKRPGLLPGIINLLVCVTGEFCWYLDSFADSDYFPRSKNGSRSTS